MEYLRWILLVAGLFFVLVIYLIGARRRWENTYSDYDSIDDAPDFSAKDWDNTDGVGDVHIVARENVYDDSQDEGIADYNDEYADESFDEIPDHSDTDTDTEIEIEIEDEDDSDPDVIMLYILARSSGQLSGDKINSAAQANSLAFGKMNIFHRLDGVGASVFSLASMVEPGSFDADDMHEMQTPGIILFMQVSAVENPAKVFDDMLDCAYHVSEMLDAQLCNRKRQPITQSDAELYREIVARANA